MRKINAFFLLVFVFLLVVVIIQSLPAIECYLYCSGVVKTTTLASAVLYSGTSATNSSPASTSLMIALNSPGFATYITSLTLSRTGYEDVYYRNNTSTLSKMYAGDPFTAITNWDNNSQPSSAANLISFGTGIQKGNSLEGGTVTTLVLYPRSLSPQKIVAGVDFYCTLEFANGDSISGSLIAQ